MFEISYIGNQKIVRNTNSFSDFVLPEHTKTTNQPTIQ